MERFIKSGTNPRAHSITTIPVGDKLLPAGRTVGLLSSCLLVGIFRWSQNLQINVHRRPVCLARQEENGTTPESAPNDNLGEGG